MQYPPVVLTGLFWISYFTVHCEKVCFKDLKFAVATAAYQIEGAWKTGGKGESIWDYYTHKHPERIFDHTNGDVAADSYHRLKDDVRLMKELGVHVYRFSISWPRILPSGFSNHVNEDGIRYYMELLEELKANGIQPMVTMYHWDLPQNLQTLGGWTNPIVVDYFVDYARVLFERFGPMVHSWLTFNEPLSFCGEGYGGNDAPGGWASGLEDYMCGHNVLKAHAKVYRMYHSEYNLNNKGVLGITLDITWMEPATAEERDREAAERALQFMFGWFAHPILSVNGDYPPVMRKRVDEMSKLQNFTRSRLPRFTNAEIQEIKGSTDFLGVNHYTTNMARHRERSHNKVSFSEDRDVYTWKNSSWPKSNSSWLRVVPWGFRKVLNWIKDTYNNPIVLVTENGVSDKEGLDDVNRIQYIDGYLRALHDAVEKDGCRVLLYTHWSLIDNFEWMRGYSERFGLYEVDYKSPSKTRTARSSARYYADVIKTGCVLDQWVDHVNYNVQILQ